MRIGELITGVALVAFMLALYSIEALSAKALITMFVAGGWIVGYAFWQEEKRASDGR